MGVKDLPSVPMGFLFVRPEELAGMRRDPEWCADADADVKRLFNGDAERAIAAKPVPTFDPTAFDRAMADVVRQLMCENPPPPDVLLPEGCSRWWPRVDVVDREEGLCARLTWEARR